MTVAEGKVIIEIEVDDSDLDKIKEKEANELTDANEALSELTGNQGKDSMVDEIKAHGLISGGVGAFGGVGGAKNVMAQASAGVSNPAGMLKGLFSSMPFMQMFMKMIPHVALIIMAAEIVPLAIKGIIDKLTAVGAPFDKRFKRMMKDERNAFFNREEQKKRQLGLSPVIMTSVSGFRNIGGFGAVWTLKEIREQNGIAPIGLRDKAGGLTG